jgi:hypothetical protein
MNILHLSRTQMTRKLNYERTNQDRKPHQSLKDEEEFTSGDLAGRWLKAKEEKLSKSLWGKFKKRSKRQLP